MNFDSHLGNDSNGSIFNTQSFHSEPIHWISKRTLACRLPWLNKVADFDAARPYGTQPHTQTHTKWRCIFARFDQFMLWFVRLGSNYQSLAWVCEVSRYADQISGRWCCYVYTWGGDSNSKISSNPAAREIKTREWAKDEQAAYAAAQDRRNLPNPIFWELFENRLRLN